MSDQETDNPFIAWLATRPAHVQAFAARYPFQPGDIIEAPDGTDRWFFGYREFGDGVGVGLIVTAIDPMTDYDAAYEARECVCPEYFE